MRGKKRKIRNNQFDTVLRSFPIPPPFYYTRTLLLAHSLCDSFSMEATRRKQVRGFLVAHKSKDVLALYSSPLIGCKWSEEMHFLLLSHSKVQLIGSDSFCLLREMVSQGFVMHFSKHLLILQ